MPDLADPREEEPAAGGGFGDDDGSGAGDGDGAGAGGPGSAPLWPGDLVPRRAAADRPAPLALELDWMASRLLLESAAFDGDRLGAASPASAPGEGDGAATRCETVEVKAGR